MFIEARRQTASMTKLPESFYFSNKLLCMSALKFEPVIVSEITLDRALPIGFRVRLSR